MTTSIKILILNERQFAAKISDSGNILSEIYILFLRHSLNCNKWRKLLLIVGYSEIERAVIRARIIIMRRYYVIKIHRALDQVGLELLLFIK